MSQKQELIDRLIPLLKGKGYKKKSNTWYKETADLVILFNKGISLSINSCF